jgi:hypothetical protein
MKYKNLLVTLSIGLSIFNPAFAASGGYSGGGGDLHEVGVDSAWYLGQGPVTYCIERSDKFIYSIPEIQKTFEAAANLWKSYIQDRRIHFNEPLDHRLNLNFQYSGACTGLENLRIYLGVENSAVAAAKKKFERPYAFAIRESYDLDKKMGKGFMWFAETASIYPNGGSGFPNWHDPYTLQGMMTHEIGHILGVGHIDGTIMDADLMSDLQMMDPKNPAMNSRGKAKLTSIDDLKILRFSWNSSMKVPGRISYIQSVDQTANTFKDFMGRMPVGNVRLTLTCQDTLKLTIGDDSSENVFDIKGSSELRNEFSLGGNIFSIHFVDKYNTAISLGTVGYSGIGSITSLTGKIFTVHYSINASALSGPFQIKYIDGEKVKDLFISNVKGSQFN